MAGRLARAALAEAPAWLLLALAATVGVLWAACLFDWEFVAGRDAFWQLPMGADMQTVLTGYFYYVQSPWQLPLFYVSQLGAPTGANVVFTDVVPVAALAGKLVRSLGAGTVNPYGTFLFLCFALPGVAMTLVLIAARTRCALAALVGAIFADTMPALLWRWGDIALEAQFLLIGALALYLASLRAAGWRCCAAAWAGGLAFAYLTNIYLFAMVACVWLCALAQRRLDGLATARQALTSAIAIVAPVTLVIVLGGQFGAGGGLPFAEFGRFSMNLLSPFAPQMSGLFPRVGGPIDATGGQYEGFNYLGAGLLSASLILLPAEAAWLKKNARRHRALLLALAALTGLAVSDRIYLGEWLLVKLPMPGFLDLALGIFRSSGRFFWLVGYAQIAVVLALAFRRPRPGIALCLVLAAALQLLDVEPLRARIVTSIAAGAGAAPLDRTEVARLVGSARFLEVVPSFQCSATIWQASANMQLMLAAARADVPTNTVYLARQSYGLGWRDALRAPSRFEHLLRVRHAEYCRREIEKARLEGKPGGILVLLSDRPERQQMAPGMTCSHVSAVRYCRTPRNPPPAGDLALAKRRGAVAPPDRSETPVDDAFTGG